MRVLAVGGGSGGHVTPVAAVISELKKSGDVTDSFDALRTGADRTHPVILYAGKK